MTADLDLIADCGLRVETAHEATLPQSGLGPVGPEAVGLRLRQARRLISLRADD